MTGRRGILALSTAIMLVAGATIAYAVVDTFATRPPTPRPGIGVYRAVPTTWLVRGEMRFTRLSEAASTSVTVSASAAERTAEEGFARSSNTRVVFESLGGYVDVNQIVHDWVGTRSWIPPVRPAYFVRLAGVNIPSVGPRRGASHHVDVIVSAVTGREICAVAFS